MLVMDYCKEYSKPLSHAQLPSLTLQFECIKRKGSFFYLNTRLLPIFGQDDAHCVCLSAENHSFSPARLWYLMSM